LVIVVFQNFVVFDDEGRMAVSRCVLCWGIRFSEFEGDFGRALAYFACVALD